MNKTSIDISSMLDDDFSDSNLDAKKALFIIVYFSLTIKYLPYFLQLTLTKSSIENAFILILPITLFGITFSTITSVTLTKHICRGKEKYNRIVDPAWSIGKPIQLFYGALFGIFTYILITFVIAIFPNNNGTIKDPNFYAMGKLTFEKFSNFIVLFTIIISYSISSIAEELFFRGVALAGFTKSFGKNIAIVFSSICFIFYHYPKLGYIEILTYILISSFAIHLRLKYRAIGPAIALHLSYNLSIITFISINVLIN